MPSELEARIEAAMKRLSSKVAFAPQGSMPAPDPTMGGAVPPMDPAAMGGAPMPPMDPAAMGGAPPMDPAAMGGMPPADPAAMGGMPPMDPAAMGGAPAEPTPPGLQPAGGDPMQMLSDVNDKIDALGDLVLKLCRHFNVSLAEDEGGAEQLVNDEELDTMEAAKAEDAAAQEPLSDQAQEAIGGNDFIKKQLEGLGGGY